MCLSSNFRFLSFLEYWTHEFQFCKLFAFPLVHPKNKYTVDSRLCHSNKASLHVYCVCAEGSLMFKKVYIGPACAKISDSAISQYLMVFMSETIFI